MGFTISAKVSEAERHLSEVTCLLFHQNQLYSGADDGKVKVLVWENDQQVGKYEVGEEVWDLLVKGDFLLTVRNLDVSIIQMHPGGKQYTFLQSLDGRSPLQKVGDCFCFMDREGRGIKIHELSKESKFKANGEIKAHDMIVNALCCVDEPQPTIFSGGYDKVVKRWDMKTQDCTASANLDMVINDLVATSSETAYVAGALGYIAKVDFQ